MTMVARRRPARPRQPNEQASVEGVLQIRALERVAAFGAGAPCAADQAAHRAITGPIGCERHELESIGAIELRADDQRHFKSRCLAHDLVHPGDLYFAVLGLGDVPVDINSGSEEELHRIPAISNLIASRIVDLPEPFFP